MISNMLPLFAFSIDSLFATVLLSSFVKNKWQFAGLLGLFDALAYLIGMTLPITGFLVIMVSVIVGVTAGVLLFNNKLPWAVALALSGDNLVQGMTRSAYLSNHGLLAKCWLSGTVLAHTFAFGLASFTMAALGLSIVYLMSRLFKPVIKNIWCNK